MKKKNKLLWIICICYIIQVINFSGIMVYAQGLQENVAKVSYTIEGNTNVGDVFDIVVNMENVTDLYGASLDFKYDPEVIEIQSIDKGDIFNDKVKVPVKNISSGNASIVLTYIGSSVDTSKSRGSLVKIKAKALKSNTIKLKAIDDNSQLSIDSNNIRIKLSNSNAEKIEYTKSQYSINIVNKLQTLAPGTYEDTNTGLVYTGNWSNLNNSNYSGGTVKVSETKGDTVEFKFNGTSFDLYGHASDWRGKAKIYIDGTAVETIDCYSATNEYSKKLYSKSGLASGVHTVKVEVLGEKNTASNSTKVAIDKVVVKNTIIYEDSNSALSYKGTWSSLSNSGYSGGTVKVSETKGDTVEFTFNGTSFEIYGHASDWRGKAKIYIDGTAVETIDCYSATNEYSKKLYSKSGLASGTHTVKIEVLGEKNTSSKAVKIAIDKIITN